jgi:TonB family protein
MDSERDQIEKYLKGTLTAAERHALERKALSDPFLHDALEGGATISPEDFSADVRQLQAKINGSDRRSLFTPLRIAAGVALLVSVSLVWLLTNNNTNNQPPASLAQKDQRSESPADSARPATKPETDQRLSLNEARPVEEQPRTGRDTRAMASERLAEKAPAEVEVPESVVSEEDLQAEIVAEEIAEAKPAAPPSVQQEESKQALSREMKKEAAAVPYAAGARIATRQIQGQVKSETGEPLPGVNVLQKGTANGTVTDARGFYALNLTDTATPLVFSFIGMKTNEVATGDQDRLDVTLAEDLAQLSEVVVTGLRTGDTDVRTPVIKLAEPYGGRKAYDQYLEKNLRYPVQALEQKVKGRVTIEFTVQTDGVLSDFHVLRSLGYGCDEEVIRLVKEGPRWFPTTEDDVPVESNVRVRMKFDPAKAGQ